MTTLQRAVQAMQELHSHAVGFRNGEIPNPNLILGIQADLVLLHMELGQEMAQKFSTKEQAYLSRRIAEASQYMAGRGDITRKLAATDAQQEARLKVTAESTEEIRSAMEFEQYRTLLKSIQNAIESTRQVVSFVGRAENHPSHIIPPDNSNRF